MIKLLSIFLFVFVNLAHAWPTKDITLIVPFAPGGPSDIVARAYQQELEQTFKVNVLVKYMPGPAHSIAINHILNNENDGHTFLQVNDDFISGQYLAGTRLYEQFVPVHIIGKHPFVMFGGPGTSQEKFLADVKAGNVINVGTIGVNSLYSLWVGNIQNKPSLKLNLVPYKGGADIIRDVIAGHVTYGVGTLSTANADEFIKDGKLKPILHVGGDARFKNVLSINELGMTAFTANTWIGTFARKNTPPQAIEQMSLTLKRIAPAVIKNLRQFEIVNLTSKDAEKFVASEIQMLDQLTKNANIQKTVQ